MGSQLDRVESKVDKIALDVVELRVDLEVHKVKTGRWAMLLGVAASLVVAVIAFFFKG